MHTLKSNASRLNDRAKGEIFDKLREFCKPEWQRYIHHSFIQQLADGTLPAECFRKYLIQLYLFSKNYSRAYAMAVVKSDHLDDLKEATVHLDMQLNYEMELHIDYCAQWGISQEQLEKWPEEDANRLYTRYVLDQGLTGDSLDLLVALSPCSLGYAEIGKRLIVDPETKFTGNPYREWIELHGGVEFQDSASGMKRYLDREAKRRGISCTDMSSERWESLITNFRTAIHLEIQFWQMGLTK